MIGREKYLDILKKYAQTESVGNQAFLGVKGVGKTSLFLEYFTRNKKKELARDYRNLFVFTQLDSRKKGEDLYRFLIDQVRLGIMSIPDEEEKRQIKEEMAEIDEIFDTPDSRLTQYLNTVREHRYDFIVIMDHFHVMTRDTEIGQEQYDVLRSFNEHKYITYWIITDTDLTETCATEDYHSSFFPQKFTSKTTIRPVGADDRREITLYFAKQKQLELTEEETDIITELAGGIPQLVPALLDILMQIKRDGLDIDRDFIAALAVRHGACSSLFDGWTTGLSKNHRRTIYTIAETDLGMAEDDFDYELIGMADLSDDIGRGVLHVERTETGRIWTINTDIFRHYILSKGAGFYEDKETGAAAAPAGPAQTPVTNIFNIGGDFIQSQTNNVINIQNAVTSLENLYRLVNGGPTMLTPPAMMDDLKSLPFGTEEWEQLSEEEQEEGLDEFADSIFKSAIFADGMLSPEQMQRFCLSDETLNRVPEQCRKQIICGIQIYDLIQMCIDKFGLDMSVSESPRGILFCRAFERILKDLAAPVILKIDDLACHKVFPSNKRFKDTPLDKTTIGNYQNTISFGSNILARISADLLHLGAKNKQWWKDLSKRMEAIGDLRNKCCHSGNEFKENDLNKLIQKLFEDQMFDDILVLEGIRNLEKNTIDQLLKGGSSTSGSGAETPSLALIGKEVEFEIVSLSSRGDLQGIVNGKYKGVLPKAVWSPPFDAVKGSTILVIADRIQNGVFVLKL